MKTVLQTAVMILALSFAGCGSSADKTIHKEYTGRYILSEISGGTVDDGVSTEEINELKEYGLVCELILKEDGTAVMNNYGDEEQYTWGGNTLFSTDSEDSIGFEYNDEVLTVRDENTSQALTFIKMTDNAN